MVDKGNRLSARRPDKAIYVPRAMRHKIDLEQQSLKESSGHSSSDVAKEHHVSNQETEIDGTHQSLADQEFEQLSRSGPAWDQTVSVFMSLTLDDQADENCANTTVLPVDATLQQQNFDESLLSEVL